VAAVHLLTKSLTEAWIAVDFDLFFHALVKYRMPGRENGKDKGVAQIELDAQGPAGDLRHRLVPSQDGLYPLYRAQV
jgi:hypothetical protein